MCGRYVITTPPMALAKKFAALNPPPNFQPHWNAAPSQDLPVIRYNPATQQRSLDVLRWGLVPIWAKDLAIGNQAMNARSESLESKPMFRDAYEKRRCLVPAEAFYEWQGEKNNKQPYAIAMKDREVFAFAGLWERWRHPENGEITRSFTIVTGLANELTAPIHDRMPIILPENTWAAWLDEEKVSPQILKQMLTPYSAREMYVWPVSKAVGNVRNNEHNLLDEVMIEIQY